MLLDGPDTPFSAEFTVTINLLLCREETDGRFHAAYASFCHEPDDVAEIERVLGVRCTQERPGMGGRCRAKCVDFRFGDATPS